MDCQSHTFYSVKVVLCAIFKCVTMIQWLKVFLISLSLDVDVSDGIALSHIFGEF